MRTIQSPESRLAARSPVALSTPATGWACRMRAAGEVLNTDADIYNGTGIGNYGAVEATDDPWHGRPASAVMVLPPLAALWFEPT
jgi:1,4-alpha-glucan branching enzyme